ncbi:hypothetical protein, partial [Methylobacterium sp. WL9]|uniref:hypothetical protein n=1 Tax=Methylobacterium sp. WL9 TaxID=2603898 RepID=UPI001FEF10ED
MAGIGAEAAGAAAWTGTARTGPAAAALDADLLDRGGVLGQRPRRIDHQDGRDQDRTGSAEACAQAVPSPRAGFAASIAISPIRHKQQST